MTVRRAMSVDQRVLADIHSEAFADGWSVEDFDALLDTPGISAFIAGQVSPSGDALIVIRQVADEAEVLTLAVRPSARRRGLARMLLRGAIESLMADAILRLFLEVAADNDAAIALYNVEGFEVIGRRPGYYGRGQDRIDALVLRRALNLQGTTAYDAHVG